jgi:hypothetical protein
VTPDLALTLADLRDRGPRSFAGWDAGLFDALADGPAGALALGLGHGPDAAPAVDAYLRLAHEAVGTGLVRQAAPAGAGWTGFLERCLIDLVPRLLPRVPARDRAGLLVKLWNLGEGLSREPAWLDRYAAARAGGLGDLADAEGFLVRTLAPVMAAPPPAAWSGPFAVTVLDLRPVHEGFLPGEVRLAGPAVLKVEDRRLAGLQTGVLLRPGGKSELLGLTAGLGDYAEAAGPAGGVAFADGKATVAGKEVTLPGLRRCHRHAVAASGFVAACAVDSQRLWIVESP